MTVRAGVSGGAGWQAFGQLEGELIDVEPRDQRVLACQELLERFASRVEVGGFLVPVDLVEHPGQRA